MKILKLKNIVFFFFALLLFGCEYYEDDTDISFVKFFGEGFNDYGIDMGIIDNTIVVLSNITKENKVSPCLYYFNQQGEIERKSNVLNDQSIDEFGKKLLIDGNNNLYIVSNIVDDQDNSRIHVRKMLNGNVEWSISFGGNNVSSSDALISNTDIIIVGKYWETADNIEAFFLKISKEDGQQIEQKIYRGNKGNDEAVKIIQFNDGYVFAGYTESYPPTIEGKNIWLVKLNSNGENIGPYSFGTKRINEGLALKRNGNSLIVASAERRTETGVKELNLYSISEDFNNINWHTELVDNKSVVPIDILIKGSKFVLPSNKYGLSNNGNVSLHYYDQDGNYIGNKEYGASDETILRINSSVLLDDGSLILLGYNETKGHSDVALIKVKADNEFNK